MKDWAKELEGRHRRAVLLKCALSILFVVMLLAATEGPAASEPLKKAILMCESSNMHYEPHSKRVRFGDDGISRGIAQFRKETFYEQAAVAKKDGTWPFGKPRWFSEEQQLWLLNDMLDWGMCKRWTCCRKLMQPMD